MNRDFYQRFKLMIEDLQKNENIRISKVDFHEPASQKDIELAKECANGALPTGVEDFFRAMNGFDLEWEHTVESMKENSDADRGYIHLLPIQAIFGDWKGMIWFDDFAGGERYKPVKPFDFFINEACTAFYLDSNGIPDDFVYFHYLGEELHKTQYTFLEYIDRLLASRGYWYWIATLSDDLQDRPEVTSFRTKMPGIFEDYHDALFYPKKSNTSK